tara:strand:+ start:47 stop:769 length:723 start_codon:yes stop_codon:yes gene_type:complete
MNAISILTPTRNRPNNCDRFIKSLYETTQYTGTLELLFYVDSDDPAKDIYKEIEERWQNNFWRVEFVIGEPMSVSKSWNIIAKKSLGDIMIMGNDDLVYKTVRWDSKLMAKLIELDNPYYLTWFNDGINGNRHCAFPVISREWYETLGYFSPGVFNFGYNDTWVYDIAKRVGKLNYMNEILVEHLHFSVGKSNMDDTYARNRSQEKGNLYRKDKEIYERTIEDRILAAEKIKERSSLVNN